MRVYKKFEKIVDDVVLSDRILKKFASVRDSKQSHLHFALDPRLKGHPDEIEIKERELGFIVEQIGPVKKDFDFKHLTKEQEIVWKNGLNDLIH